MDADEIRARLSSRLREAIELRGITIVELAQRAGVGRPHLYSVLTGRTGPSVDYLARLANVLDVDPAALIGTAPITRRTRRLKPSQ